MNTALAARVLDHGSAGTVLTPGDPGYEAVRSTYVSVGQPAAVVRAASTRDVAAALHFARECGLPLAVRSGGHGIDGRSTNVGGLVLDLGALNHIEIVDEATRRVRIGSGATWSQVADALAPRGWAITSGNHGGVGVGVGGLATRGGSGFLVRAHGLTIDHVRRVELVLPDGQVLHADHDEHPDLFWAVRGGGASVGVGTSVELKADPVGTVVLAEVLYNASDPASLVRG